MQKKELEQQRAAIEAQFNELTRQKETITQELYRLQGQHDLLGDLLTNFPKEEKPRGTKPRRTEEPAG